MRIFFLKVFPLCHFRVLFSKRLLSGSHSSQSNLSQASVTSDPLATDDTDGSMNSQLAKISDRRSNSSSDIQGVRDASLPGDLLHKSAAVCYEPNKLSTLR